MNSKFYTGWIKQVKALAVQHGVAILVGSYQNHIDSCVAGMTPSQEIVRLKTSAVAVAEFTNFLNIMWGMVAKHFQIPASHLWVDPTKEKQARLFTDELLITDPMKSIGQSIIDSRPENKVYEWPKWLPQYHPRIVDEQSEFTFGQFD